VFLDADVAVFLTTTDAEGTAAPEASTTRPETDAVPAACPNNSAELIAAKNTTVTGRTTRFFKFVK
jgi:hypothetical protein